MIENQSRHDKLAERIKENLQAQKNVNLSMQEAERELDKLDRQSKAGLRDAEVLKVTPRGFSPPPSRLALGELAFNHNLPLGGQTRGGSERRRGGREPREAPPGEGGAEGGTRGRRSGRRNRPGVRRSG